MGMAETPWIRAVLEGSSYRQLDYWTRSGLLTPENGSTPGTGNFRKWSESELRVAEIIGFLRTGGMELQAAGRIARVLAGGKDAVLYPGIIVRIDPEADAE